VCRLRCTAGEILAVFLGSFPVAALPASLHYTMPSLMEHIISSRDDGAGSAFGDWLCCSTLHGIEHEQQEWRRSFQGFRK